MESARYSRNLNGIIGIVGILCQSAIYALYLAFEISRHLISYEVPVQN
jgi:hypothetical protein